MSVRIHRARRPRPDGRRPFFAGCERCFRMVEVSHLHLTPNPLAPQDPAQRVALCTECHEWREGIRAASEIARTEMATAGGGLPAPVPAAHPADDLPPAFLVGDADGAGARVVAFTLLACTNLIVWLFVFAACLPLWGGR